MIKKLSGATIWSQDLGDGAGGLYLGLGTHSEVKGRAADPYRHMVGFDSDDLDADYRRLSSEGVEFIEQPTEYDGLRIATLKDPEGNLIQLFQPTT